MGDSAANFIPTRRGYNHHALMPHVSIIVPCYNEQATIALLLHALHGQTYPLSRMEVILADGMSTDGTRQAIAAFATDHPQLPIRVVDNPKRIIPAGLNAALEAAAGEIVIRLDAHSIPDADYIALCVEALQAGCGDNVGGVWDIQPGAQSWIATAISLAAAHPIGVGDAQYRVGKAARRVDTVPFGAFRRSLIERVGRFNEDLLTNEDYEFNVRVRRAGGSVWLDPRIRTAYFARPTLKALAAQYWRYGYWKARMLRMYPESIRWRQLLPPSFVLGLVLLLVAGWVFPVTWYLLAIVAGVYLAVLLGVGVELAARHRRWSMVVGVPLAIVTMHLAWGASFLIGLLSRMKNAPSTL